MELQIRQGRLEDLDQIEQLYDRINDYLDSTINYPKWKKGTYPIREDAKKGIQEQALFVALIQEKVVGSMILRHKPEPAYNTAPWSVKLPDIEVFVIYTFAVNPQMHHQGIGKAMLNFAAQYAKEQRVKALRLDVYEENSPAIDLYKKCGYQYIDTVSLGLENIGLNWFELYEKLV